MSIRVWNYMMKQKHFPLLCHIIILVTVSITVHSKGAARPKLEEHEFPYHITLG